MTTTEVRTLEAAHTAGYELARRHLERFLDDVGGLDGDSLSRSVPGSDWIAGESGGATPAR